MKPHNPILQISICLAIGGLVTIVVICFLIGFGLHSIVGKYALYTALFLQALSLLVNHATDRRYDKSASIYHPSPKMVRFRLMVRTLWTLGLALHLGVLCLLLLGMDPGEPWVRCLCIPGVILSPLGWMGILLASHRKRSAILVLLSRNSPENVEASRTM